MKSFRHEYKGFGVHHSACMVHIENIDGTNFIIFEDLSEGTSVTNASEQIATEVVKLLRLDPKECRFFETYPYNESRLDEIFYTWDLDKQAFNASWEPFMEHIETIETIFENITQWDR
jgi:hypothetical protein